MVALMYPKAVQKLPIVQFLLLRAFLFLQVSRSLEISEDGV